MRKKKKLIRGLVQAVTIAALYTVITVAENMFFGGAVNSGITKGIVQLRLADVLTVLPVFTPAAIPGLFAGCLATNKIIGCHDLDVLYGSLATLAGAIGTYLVRKKRFFAPIPPIVINMTVIPLLFTYVYRFDDRPFWQYVMIIGISGVISCGVLGIALMLGLDDYRDRLFPDDDGPEEKEEEKKEEISNTTGEK